MDHHSPNRRYLEMVNSIKRIRAERGLTLLQLANAIGTSAQQVSRLEKSERRLTQEWIEKLSAALNLPPEAFLKSEPSSHQIDKPKVVPSPDQVDFLGESYAAIPFYEANVSAGPGSVNGDYLEPSSYELFRVGWLQSISRSSVSELSIVTVAGDSMTPTLVHGDHIIVDRSVRSVGRDGLYVLAAGSDTQVKRVSRDPRSGTLTIKSDNPNAENWTNVAESDVIIFGRVIWLGRSI